MALHARLNAPPPELSREWPWHQAKWSSLPCNVLWRGDRRMEAETYLASGYGLRLAMEALPVGWLPLKSVAKMWQPSRLKGIQVNADDGVPFLAATQAYDIRPVPRKWLALERTDDAGNRYVKSGMILVTCSGSVGRATLASDVHEQVLVSHDLLRVEALNDSLWGWIYAYLRSPQARSMMTSAQYGHIIKHLETTHLNALPTPVVKDAIAANFQERTKEILRLRNIGYRLALDAEAQFEAAVGALRVQDWGEQGFTIHASDSFLSGRRRLEAMPHNPGVALIRKHLEMNGRGFTSIENAGFDVWVPGRYKRIPAQDGVAYYDSADLLEINPDSEKRFADCRFGDDYRGRVKSGWLLVPCSGQVYGIIGSVVLASEAFHDQVVSNHVIRIAPNPKSKIRSGYLMAALSHPSFGRPLVKAMAFGSSVPEINTDDLRAFEIVRLSSKDEDTIADLTEESAAKRAQADILERQLGNDAGELIDRFLAGDKTPFVQTAPNAVNKS